jgi:hypothetical protein
MKMGEKEVKIRKLLEVKISGWDLSGVEGLEDLDLGEVCDLSGYNGDDEMIKSMSDEKYVLGGVIDIIKMSVYTLDEYAEDVKALIQMNDDEWKVKASIYASKYEEYALYFDIDIDDELKKFKKFLIGKVGHEDAEDVEFSLGIATDVLKVGFKKTIEIRCEDGKSKIRVRDMIDENDRHFYYDGRIINA